MPVGSNKRRNFTPVKPAKQRCAPKVQRELKARPRGADGNSSIRVMRQDWTWPLKWSRLKPRCLSWCEEQPKSWTKIISGSRIKKSVWKVTRAFQQHSQVAMALLNQLNCTTACTEMLEKICFYQQKSDFSKTFPLKFWASTKKKKPMCIFCQNYTTIPYWAVSH